METLIDNILSAKKANPQTDTSHLEREIDELVYNLYEITEEEVGIVNKLNQRVHRKTRSKKR